MCWASFIFRFIDKFDPVSAMREIKLIIMFRVSNKKKEPKFRSNNSMCKYSFLTLMLLVVLNIKGEG
jgi:hypothetical protein